MRLRAVLQHFQSVVPGALADRRHVRGVAVQVHHQHRASAGRHASIDLRGVQRVRAGIDIAEHRTRASSHHRRDGWDARVGRHQHLIAGLDAERKQADAQGVVPVATPTAWSP